MKYSFDAAAGPVLCERPSLFVLLQQALAAVRPRSTVRFRQIVDRVKKRVPCGTGLASASIS
jgi:hypothetical protein